MLRLLALSSLLYCYPLCSLLAAPVDYDKEARAALERALKKDEESQIYKEAYQRAVSERKPLLVWVGVRCLKCEKEMNWAVHVSLDVFQSESTARVVVGKFDGEGISRARTFYKVPTSQEVLEALNGPPRAQQFYQPPQPQCPS